MKSKVLHVTYALTSEGKDYLKNSLPEKQLIKLVDKGIQKIDQLRKELASFHIALNWAKKNNWIAISGQLLRLTKQGRSALSKATEIEGALKNPNQSSQDLQKLLLSRNLIEESKKKIFADREITQLTPEIILEQYWKTIPFKDYDTDAPAPKIYPGKKQLYRAFLDEVKEELVALGFQEMEGPLVEATFFNNDALFMPQDHPARGIHDLYFVKTKKQASLTKYNKFIQAVKKVHEKGGFGSTGWQIPFSEEVTRQLVLRSQGTSLSVRTLMNNPKIPGAYFAVARNYRPDVLDATHLTEFNQLEGIILNENLSFKHLLGLMKKFAKNITGNDNLKFLPGYFPFTEPSVEGYLYFKELKKWIEVMPAGIFRPELTKPLGIDIPVLAWGMGIDRLFMIKHGISDIRKLFSNDLNFLREAKI